MTSESLRGHVAKISVETVDQLTERDIDELSDAAEAAILAAKHAEEMREEIDEYIREYTTLWSGAPVWTPNKQWTKENWKDWRTGEDIRCVDCGEEYPEDHDGEGFENGRWYCCWCWDKKFLHSDEETTV